MRIAHFGVFAPHGAGQYETVKDLILAERSVGLDAQFIDFGHNGEMTSREGLKDGEKIETYPLWWAQDADILVSHSAVPEKMIRAKPTILALHGRPEYSFRLEFNKVSPVMSAILGKAKRNLYAAYVTFWQEFLFPWSRIMVGRKLRYIPSPVDFDLYTPNGDKREFAKSGHPNIVICDMWREDTIPFNLLFAAQYFKEHYQKDARLHIYGLDKSTAFNVLAPFKRLGLIGETYSLVSNLPEIYRAADMVITPNVIATRIIRESLASGTPVVAPVGCRWTPYQADPRDYKAFAREMNRCFEEKPDPASLRKSVFKHFNPTVVGEAMRELCEKLKGGGA